MITASFARMPGCSGPKPSAAPREVQRFYDDFFATRMLQYRIEGNLRIDSAIARALPLLTPASHVLEIGCGIGIVAEALAAKARRGRVVAVDTSERNIWYARRTVRNPRIAFHRIDILRQFSELRALLPGPVDLFVLVDVVEHLPAEARATLFHNMSAIAAGDARVLLTYPSPEYQRYLRKEKPEELQIIDHVIELDELRRDAEAAGLRLKHFSLEDVWRPNQYVHCIFETTESSGRLGKSPTKTATAPGLPRAIARPRLFRSLRLRYRRWKYIDRVFSRSGGLGFGQNSRGLPRVGLSRASMSHVCARVFGMNTAAREAFAFDPAYDEAPADCLDAALERSLGAYLRDELGWPDEAVRARVAIENERSIPKGVLDFLGGTGWNLAGARVLDVGCGHGGAVLELLHRGADATGIEPSLELSGLARRRLKAAGFPESAVVTAGGAALPFADASIDFAISLQVLEHVRDPGALIAEVYRVLRPGGQFYLACENYLSLREPHYRVFWLPLLPKRIGRWYLLARGRKPHFLMKHVHYATYPSIRRAATDAGFVDVSFASSLRKVDDPDSIRRRPVRVLASGLSAVSSRRIVRSFATAWLHGRCLFRVGTRLLLEKPAKAQDRRRGGADVPNEGRRERWVAGDPEIEMRGAGLAIATPTVNAVSETFIAAHLRHLAPGRTVVLCDQASGTDELGIPALTFGPGRAGKPWLARKLIGLDRYVRTGSRLSLEPPQEAACRAFLGDHDVGIVLAEYGPLGCRLAHLCERAGVPLFVHFHGYDASQLLAQRRFRHEYRRLATTAAGFVAPSRYLADRLIAIGFPADRVHVIPCGVDPEIFDASAATPQSGRILAVGRLVEKKAPHLLIAAFAIAAASRPDATLEIIGDGPLMERCRDEVRARGLAARVFLHGARPHAFVIKRMRKAAVFAQHSITAPDGDTEGLPVAVLEAMMSGLPVVATRHAGIAEAVIEGETGLLVDEGDVVAMARALEDLLAAPDRARRLGEAGRRRALAQFTRDASLARLREVIGVADAPNQCAVLEDGSDGWAGRTPRRHSFAQGVP